MYLNFLDRELKKLIQAADFSQAIATSLGVNAAIPETELQELWSGYGKILRYKRSSGKRKSVVAKIVIPPLQQDHPRGWSGERSHQRKLKSYQVEKFFYQKYSESLGDNCKVPKFLGVCEVKNATVLLLEDLSDSGFIRVLEKVDETEFNACISWLAYFHAKNMKISPEGLWKSGTYWHLDTRPDELEKLTDFKLKKYAAKIDEVLSKAVPQTLVHGDAKLANFCFSENGNSVAAVDFQYVGGGCGMKDLQLFVGSCLEGNLCETQEKSILDHYFNCLAQALEFFNSPIKADSVESVWRPLYAVSWADFHRFLKGWSPNHWKINDYTEKKIRNAIDAIDAGDL